VEVTTFRTEGGYTDGRHPEKVEFISNLDDDLSRRDFTINAMAASVNGELFDPFGGAGDIKKGIIKCVGGPNKRFSEDALRMFRALRLSAELGFTIDTETLQAIYANTTLASRISSERIRVELEKTLLSKRPEIAGEMIKIGLLGKFIPISGKNPGGLEKISILPPESMLRWCAFCGILLENWYINNATELLHNLALDGKTIKACLKALEFPEFSTDKIAIKKLLSKNDVATVRCAAAVFDVLGIHETGSRQVDGSSRQGDGSSVLLKQTDNILASGECFTIADLCISGRDLLELGHPPGKELGITLNRLLEHVIENPGDNTRDKLLQHYKNYDIIFTA
jgi:tRNA nucleotidyltransferase (CCA-adding enzyme)